MVVFCCCAGIKQGRVIGEVGFVYLFSVVVVLALCGSCVEVVGKVVMRR